MAVLARGHRQVDHTADIALEVWGSSLAELYVETASAVVAIMSEGALIAATYSRSIALSGLDADDLLVRWVNEMIYLAITDGFLFSGAEITVLDAELSGTIFGEANASAKIVAELKSATYHELKIEEVAGEHRAHVVIDV